MSSNWRADPAKGEAGEAGEAGEGTRAARAEALAALAALGFDPAHDDRVGADDLDARDALPTLRTLADAGAA